jgi:hypothetical protein
MKKTLPGGLDESVAGQILLVPLRKNLSSDIASVVTPDFF